MEFTIKAENVTDEMSVNFPNVDSVWRDVSFVEECNDTHTVIYMVPANDDDYVVGAFCANSESVYVRI